jgi:hypothetical protein
LTKINNEKIMKKINIVIAVVIFSFQLIIAQNENKNFHPININTQQNTYNGIIKTDDNGLATIKLSDFEQSENLEFIYKLTTIQSFSKVMIDRELNNNEFVIMTELPNVKVSWEITIKRTENLIANNEEK